MLSYLIKRNLRRPLSGLLVILFGLIMTLSLCALQTANEAAQARYDQMYDSIPVEVSVTNLSGTRSDNLEIPGWVMGLFDGEGVFTLDLADFVTDLQVKLRLPITEGPAHTLIGISSLEIASELSQEQNGSVIWRDGYDESILQSGDMVCIVPESLSERNKIRLVFQHKLDSGEFREYECGLTVVGTYVSDKGEGMLFCPLEVTEIIHQKLGQDRQIDAIRGRLKNNRDLAAFEKQAGYWFASPNPTGAKTPWNFGGYAYYPYALDVDDSLLKAAALSLENSLFINGVCTWLILVISAGAGFFISFLMIRQRKREIALMRTLGTGTGSILAGILVEQTALLLVGAVLGGVWFGWNPKERIGLFCGVYFAGLISALAVFLKNNLLRAIKEDE